MGTQICVDPKRPLRILHVTATLNRGGIETWLRHALVRLPGRKYQFDICTYEYERGAYAADLERAGCKIHFVPRGSGPFALLRFASGMRHLLRNGSYDAAHCHGLLFVGFLLLIARISGIRARIGHAHSTDRRTESRLKMALTRIALAINRSVCATFATHAIGCSDEAGASLFGPHWRQNPAHSIIHCGIDLVPFGHESESISTRKQLGIPPNAKVIGHVSNFSIAKNPFFLAEVAAEVFRRSDEAMLLLVGDGPLRTAAERRCTELGISERVIFTGSTSRVPTLLRCMDIFVMPSLHEGLPLALLEAQASALPCLVSDGVSRESEVTDGSLRFLPLSLGHSAWADAVLEMTCRPARQTHVLNAMKESDFNIEVSAAKLADLYDRACNSSRMEACATA